LLKPVQKVELLHAILRAFGGEQMYNSIATRPERVLPASPCFRVLLVEDNQVNQIVALRILENLGCTPVLAKNGKEALSLLSRGGFDLVLMDVQMPEMDGLTATQHIRMAETGTERHVPIFAMTARAMQGDRDMCLAAGMDGYLSKPINVRELELVLKQIGSREVADRSRHGTGNTDTEGEASVTWNAREILTKIGGDEALFREVSEIFLKETPKLIAQLEQAVATKDARMLEFTAHKLKGELGYFGLKAASQAKELERMGRETQLEHAAVLLMSFKTEVAALLGAVRKQVLGDSAHA